MEFSASACVLLALAVALCVLLYSRRNAANLPYPPGPSGLPILGNLLDIPKPPEWSTYLQWSEKYSKLCNSPYKLEDIDRSIRLRPRSIERVWQQHYRAELCGSYQ